MEKKMKGLGLLMALTTVGLLAGCTKEPSLRHEEGTQIIFGASTEWENEPETRTEYSGADQTGSAMSSTSTFERIDWKSGTDQIRILCDAATGGTKAGNKAADYVIDGTPTISAQKSLASIKPAEGNGLQWGTGDHYFYALYPVPGMKSNYDFGTETKNTVQEANVKIESVSENKAKITGVIPASQDAVKVGNIYKPNMNYAYMYAVTKTDANTTGTVPLTFNPLVTAFEFSILSPAGDPITSKLTSVKLSSTSTSLTGTFEATLSDDAAPTITTTGTTGKVITVTIPGGVTLSATTPVTVTMLALPVSQTQLTLELNFENGAKRTLDLKKENNTQWVTVAACKKLYVYKMGVPGSIYYLDVTGPASSLAPEASSTTYTVKSYRDATGEDVGVGWTATFSTDNGVTWSTSKPSWLTSFVSSDASGSVTAKSYSASVNANNTTESYTWEGSTSESGNNTKANAIDLATVDILGNATGAGLTTANCYVISKPGWYKIPCVYGNALKYGAANTSAYQNSNTQSYSLNKFVRHDDGAITNPWIRQNGFTISGASLVWQDRDGLVSDIQYESDYIYFHVPASKINEGNAVIAAIVGGKIAWSWHIWVIESSMLTTTKIYSSSENPGVVNPVDMLDTNLGWASAGNLNVPRSVRVRITQSTSGKSQEFVITQRSDHSFGGNVYYQWGRKDPMLGFDEFFRERQQYYTNSNYKFRVNTVGADFHYENAAPTGTSRAYSLGGVIQRPYEYMCGGLYWSKNRYDNLWNANAQFGKDVRVVKTVYDPSPVGFKMPSKNAFSGFSIANTIGHFQYGWNFKASSTDTQGVFFAATSLREHADGTVRGERGEVGFYYTSAINTDTSPNNYARWSPYYLEFGSNYANPLMLAGTTTYGFSVRPIKE